jgi:gluconolactonase
MLLDFKDEAGCDGMTVDSKGHIYLTARSLKRPGVLVIDTTGKEVAFIPTGIPNQPDESAKGLPSNVTFGSGDDRHTLYITVDVSLYRISLQIPGFSPFPRQ